MRTSGRPRMCRCCGTPCPIYGVWGDGNEREWFYSCLVCRRDWDGLNGDRIHLEALYGPGGWTDRDIPSAAQLRKVIASAWDADMDEPETPTAGTRAWVRRFLLDASRQPPAHPDLPTPPACQRDRFPAGRCGASDRDDDLRATPAWNDLVLELCRSGALDLPDRLALLPYNSLGAPVGMILEPRMEGFGRQEPRACVFMDQGPGGYLYVDPFTGTASFETSDKSVLATAWNLYRDWVSSVPDPVFAVVGCAARSAARHRWQGSQFADVHRYLVAAQLPDGVARQTAVALIRAGADLTPAELAVAAADAAGDPRAADRWGGPARSWPAVVPPADWVAWDV